MKKALLFGLLGFMFLLASCSCSKTEEKVSRWCESNLRQIMIALSMYTNDHDDTLPPAAKWEESLKEYYGGDRRVIVCPAVNLPYRYFGDGQKVKYPPESNRVVFACAKDHDGKCWVAFLDGSVMPVATNELEAAIKAAKPGKLPVLKFGELGQNDPTDEEIIGELGQKFMLALITSNDELAKSICDKTGYEAYEALGCLMSATSMGMNKNLDDDVILAGLTVTEVKMISESKGVAKLLCTWGDDLKTCEIPSKKNANGEWKVMVTKESFNFK